MKQLPETYIVQKFYEYSGYPQYKRTSNVYNACCSLCREGNSWGRKKRLFYIPSKNVISCHNCAKNWSPLNWIKEVSGLTYSEIMQESSEHNSNAFEFAENKQPKKQQFSTLPEDSINLFDPQQVEYYKDNKIIQDAVKYIKKRKLDVLINRPKALYISLKDYVHKNRLCIPFYSGSGEIEFYQTRAIYRKDELDRPKYLSKINAEKTIYGLNNFDPSLEYMFIFEGPIDSMCVTNGCAMGGINMTEKQQEQLQKYVLFKKIWVLDNQLDNNEVKNEMNTLIERHEMVFIWPEKFKEFKDMNEICRKYSLNQISPKFFINNAYNGIEAMMKMQG